MAAGSHMTAEIWSLTLEIIHLLTGETYPEAQPGNHVTITVTPPPSLTSDRHALQKILDVTRKITELLIGEMESHLELCLEVEAEPVTREAGVGGDLWSGVKMEASGVIPVRTPMGEDGDRSAAGEAEPCTEDESSHVIGADPRDNIERNVRSEEETEEVLSVRIKEEEIPVQICPDSDNTMESNVRSEEEEEEVFQWIKEEEIPLQISADGRYSQNKTEEHAVVLSHVEKEEDITAKSTRTTLSHPAPSPADLSSQPSIHWRRTGSPPHHPAQTSKKPHSCSQCGKCFICKSDLIRHERVHTGEKPYPCSQCEKSFTSKHGLSRHEIIHTGDKPYSCSECGKCFPFKSYLIRHVEVHTGEKPHSCSECEKCFARKSALIRHERRHKGDKQYSQHSCSTCGKCFPSKSDLIRHERVHTGEKPYPCSLCGKCFSCKAALVMHERIHTGEKPYSCSQCGKCFTQKSGLNYHEKIHIREKSHIFML